MLKVGTYNKKMKTDVVKAHLRSDLAHGRIPPGEPLPSVESLARRYRVSTFTANRALAELAAEGCLNRIPGKGTFAAEQQKSAAGASTVALRVLLCLSSASETLGEMPRFNRELVLGVMNQGHLCDCTISTTDFNGAGTYLDALRAGEYHGVIWDRPEPAQHGIIDRLREACVPQVLVSRKYAGLPMVSCHYQEGMRQAVRYLYGIGHRSILLIDQPPEKAGIIRARQEAFLDQAERYGITKECQCLNHGEKTMRPEECDIARMLRVHRTFTAVIADSSFISMLKRCLDDAQLSVPGDLSVIQSGETDLFHRNSSHPFTILTDPRFEIGGMALELIGKLNRGEKIAPESEYLISGRLIADRGCAIPQNLRSILNQME